MRYRRLMLTLLVAAGAASPAGAAVTITFYSHDFGSSFPHAFVVLEGTPDAGGPAVDGNYGFTARRISPAILAGPVAGGIESAGRAYVAHSRPHWRMRLSDARYRAVAATMARWRAIPGRSYDLGKRNCVHFVADLARTLGLDVTEPKELMRRPRSFLEHLLARNRTREVAGSEPPTLEAAATGDTVPDQSTSPNMNQSIANHPSRNAGPITQPARAPIQSSQPDR